MRKIIGALLLSLTLGACADLQAVTGTFKTVTETVVPEDAAIAAGDAFDILKAGATNYGQYCINYHMTPSICSAATRRVVIKAVRGGTAASRQLKASVKNGTPAAASIYNVLVTAITSLQRTPAANVQFVETK